MNGSKRIPLSAHKAEVTALLRKSLETARGRFNYLHTM